MKKLRQELIQFCDGLSLPEMVGLWEYLSDQIVSANAGYRRSLVRGQELMKVMAEVMDMDDISYTCRGSAHLWARAMVAYRMRMEGYTYIEIGRQLRKSHTTVIHMVNKMTDALSLPRAFADILDIWNIFQNKIRNGQEV